MPSACALSHSARPSAAAACRCSSGSSPAHRIASRSAPISACRVAGPRGAREVHAHRAVVLARERVALGREVDVARRLGRDRGAVVGREHPAEEAHDCSIARQMRFAWVLAVSGSSRPRASRARTTRVARALRARGAIRAISCAPKGRGVVDAFLLVNLSSGAAFKPVSLSPDIVGATDKLTVGLVHSTWGETGFAGVGIGDTLCLSGRSNGCASVYHDVALDGRYELERGKWAWAADGGLDIISTSSPFELSLKAARSAAGTPARSRSSSRRRSTSRCRIAAPRARPTSRTTTSSAPGDAPVRQRRRSRSPRRSGCCCRSRTRAPTTTCRCRSARTTA